MAENQGEREWIVEPPGRGQISLHVSWGEGVELTPDQEDALSALLHSLESGDAEVMGHATTCTNNCGSLECKLDKCLRLSCSGTLETKIVAGPITLMGTFGAM